MQQPFRPPPKMPITAYQTFQIVAPPDVKIKTVCEDIGCQAWRHGWRSTIDESTALGRAQASYIRHVARRTYREDHTGEGLTVFTFESGQRCFAEHHTRPETHLVRGGDHRANTGLIRRHENPADWVDDFANHQQKLADRQKRG